jgi:hypothetical protein
MAKTRSFGGVTAGIWECVKTSSEKEHGTKYEPRGGIQGTATTKTLVGEIVLDFGYDRAKETLNYTINKKPFVVTENRIWDGIQESIDHCRGAS